MSHFVYCKTTAPAGDWANVVQPLAAWCTAIDQQLFAAVNGDGGGSWNPSSSIIIGGAGLNVTGLFQASNMSSCALNGSLTISGAGSLVAGTGSTSTWQSGSALTAAPGSHVNMLGVTTLTTQAGSSVAIDAGSSFLSQGVNTFGVASTTTVQGAFAFDPSIPPTFTAPKTVIRGGLFFGGAFAVHLTNTAPNGTATAAWCAWPGSTPTKVPCVQTHSDPTGTNPTRVGDVYGLDLPNLVDGSTLTDVFLVVSGTGTPTTYPTFTVFRATLGSDTITALNASFPTVDGVSTYSGRRHSIDLVCNTNNVVDLQTYRYFVQCTPPVGATNPAQTIYNCYTSATSTKVAR